MHLSIIVAVAENDVVGRNNALPWYIPDDLKYFKKTTMGKPVVMGRKTFESIGRPLPGRTNIVVTRNRAWTAEGVRAVASLNDALDLAGEIALIDGRDELMVIGGAQIYRAAIPLADRLYITEVHSVVCGDAIFPTVDWSQWREISRENHLAVEPNPHDFSFVIHQRK